MATLIDEPCTGGSDGANATTGNTDFTGFNPNGTVPKFLTVSGRKGLDCTTTGTYRYATFTNGSLISTVGARFKFKFHAFPDATSILCHLMATAVNRCHVQVLTNGTARLRNESNTAVGGSSSALAVDTEYRCEVWASDTGNQMRMAIYLGNSATALFDTGVQTYGGATINDVKVGNLTNSTWDGLLIWDVKAIDTASFPGPPVSAPSVDAGADQAVQDYHAASIDATVSGNTGTTTYAWTVTSGPSTSSSQFSSTSTVDTTFTPAGGPGTYTLRLAVTDDSGTTTDTCTVEVTALTNTHTVASVLSSSGYSAAGGAASVEDALVNGVGYVVVTDPSSADLKYQMTGVQPPGPGVDYVHTIPARRNGGSSGTEDVSLYKPDGSTLVKKVTGVTLPSGATRDPVVVTFAAADITGMSDANWRAGVVVLREPTTA